MRLSKTHEKYDYVYNVSRILAPIMTVAFYVAVVGALLLVIISAIVYFVKVPVDEMLLPPFMKEVVSTAGVASYSIDFGVGFKVEIPREGVTLSDIKSVIYSFILFLVASLATLTPIFKFLSRFFHNVAERNLFSQDNARMINFTGFAVIIADFLTGLASQFNIYTLASTFLPQESGSIDVSLSFSWSSLVVGGFIIILGSVYGCVCEVYRKRVGETTAVVSKDEVEG